MGGAMKLLFLGGAGNISAECAALLHKRGHEILVVGRGRTPVPAAYRSVRADRKDLGSLREAVKDLQPDVVLNFIGYEPAELRLDYELFRGRIAQYIYISSTTVYARPPARLPMTEAEPQGNPWWDYGQKKIACEEWLRQSGRETGFPFTIVRPSHTYSKRWIPNALSSSSYTFAARLEAGKPVFVHDDGTSAWTLTAASDFAVGLAGLVGRPETIGEAFHITGDEVLSWNQIYAEIAAALGVADPRIIPVPTDFICHVAPKLTGTLKGDKANPGVFDNAKIKRWVPEFGTRKPFRVGVRESVDWLRAHPEAQNLNPELDRLVDEVLAQWNRCGRNPRETRDT